MSEIGKFDWSVYDVITEKMTTLGRMESKTIYGTIFNAIRILSRGITELHHEIEKMKEDKE